MSQPHEALGTGLLKCHSVACFQRMKSISVRVEPACLFALPSGSTYLSGDVWFWLVKALRCEWCVYLSDPAIAWKYELA